MSEKQIRTIQAFELRIESIHPLQELIKWLTDRADENIPHEFLGTAKVNLDDRGYNGDTDLWCSISYDRPETNQEQTKRLKAEKARVAFDEHSQRQTYEKLKRKFEPQTK